MYKNFLNAREQYLPIHDIDVQRWGLQAAKQMNLDDFQASITWLLEFKKRHGICSRKITNIVTKSEIDHFDDIKRSEEEFLQKFHQLSEEYLPKQILNTDQVGIEKELHSTQFKVRRKLLDLSYQRMQPLIHILSNLNQFRWQTSWADVPMSSRTKWPYGRYCKT